MFGRPSQAPPPDAAQVYAPTTSRLGAVGFAVFCAWWLYGLAVGGDTSELTRTAPWLLLAALVVHAVFWRPAVLVDDTAVTLRNPLRTTRVPWPCVEGLDTKWSLVVLAAGGRHRSWAAAAPGRPPAMTGSVLGRIGSGAGRQPRPDLPDPRWTPGEPASSRASAQLSSDSGAAAFLVSSAWARWQQSTAARTPAPDAAVEVAWNVLTLGAAGVLLALGLVALVG